LGAFRVLWLAPQIGVLAATVFELPVMLAISWWIARWSVRRFSITNSREALAMGALAFAFLMIAELVLATAAFGQTLPQWLSGYRQVHALLGLFGQLLFGLFPLLQVRDQS
jgi:hypothetical protein